MATAVETVKNIPWWKEPTRSVVRLCRGVAGLDPGCL